MADRVVGNGPVGYMDSKGNGIIIPLSVLYFDDKGLQIDKKRLQPTIDLDDPSHSDDQKVIVAMLKSLVNDQVLQHDTTTPPAPAMKISAVSPGSAGNRITVQFKNITPDPSDPTNPKKTTFDATIHQTDIYTGLSIDPTKTNYVKKVLGTETISAAQPGLVQAQDADSDPVSRPANTNAPISLIDGGDPSTSGHADLPKNGGGGNAFTLRARKPGLASNQIQVTVSGVDSSTFNLKVDYNEDVPTIKTGDLPGKLNTYLTQVSLPDGVTSYGVPTPGTLTLVGGAEQQAAIPASAFAFSS